MLCIYFQNVAHCNLQTAKKTSNSICDSSFGIIICTLFMLISIAGANPAMVNCELILHGYVGFLGVFMVIYSKKNTPEVEERATERRGGRRASYS